MKETRKIKYLTSFMTFLLCSTSLLMSCNKPKGNLPSESETSESESYFESESELESETESESQTIHSTLKTPVLSLDNETGLVTWQSIKNAEYYRYYINQGEVLTTTATSIKLSNGQTLSVIAESSLDHIHSSQWSKPITYYKFDESLTHITIAFANCELPSVTISKGSTYKLPNGPAIECYNFEGWYLDPYYTVKATNQYVYEEDTIIYANYVAENWVIGADYWIKADEHIVSSKVSVQNGWKYIPLYIDENKTLEKGKKCFSALVNVYNTTSTEPASFIVMDGTADNNGRIYYKNGDEDFTINTDGTYRIYFSVEHAWNNNGSPRNCHIEFISSSVTNTYTPNNIPLGTLNESKELDTPILSFLEDGDSITWTSVENATGYELIFDNGDTQTSTSNFSHLNEGSFVTIRAISSDSAFLPSKWSIPLIHQIPDGDDGLVRVYFYGSNKGSKSIERGTSVDRPTLDPVKTGYEFDNWYNEISYQTLFDFSKPINENTVIYAKFNYIDYVKYQLYASDKTTKLGDLTFNNNYEFIEYTIKYQTTEASTDVYVKSVDNNYFYGPYTLEGVGVFNIYFSENNFWDLGTENERNAYWEMEKDYIYFTNTLKWSKVYLYTWNSNGFYKAWPGSIMEYYRTNSYGEDLYKFQLPSGYTNIIFSNGSGTQTVDIDLENSLYIDQNAFYPTTKNNDGKYNVGSWKENN